MVQSAQLGGSRAKLNSIKASLGGETPAQPANRSAGMYQGLAFGGSKKGKNLGQRARSLSSSLDIDRL
ncbi:Dickkopf-related protein 2 [Tupaia chinensis]|uniref:Dickkopf-related protein 2 n=1 Tax=Tupaia chinensis TaxID=246437 RepID=L9KME4_TUPCH|nr:Dickkopf-related protein 2 [Tupaia chinensis]